jgi:hypothetical protein
MPRLKQKPLDVHEDTQQIGQDRPRVMKTTGPAKDSLEPSVIEAVPNPLTKNKADILKFMEDVLTVQVHDSTDPNDDPYPCVWNGGISQYFIRGKEQQVKRKFVEVLARAKRTTYTQELFKDGAGNDTYRQIPHTAPRWPFSVLVDPHPRGRDWLKQVLAEG